MGCDTLSSSTLGGASYGHGISSLVFAERASAKEIRNNIVSQSPDENIPNTFGTGHHVWLWASL